MLERVGLEPEWYHRYPHEFSGGRRQRVGVARGLAPDPKLVVCDEPVSALDVTTQAHVVQSLGELRRDLGVSLVFIAHDLAVVRQVGDRVAVTRSCGRASSSRRGPPTGSTGTTATPTRVNSWTPYRCWTRRRPPAAAPPAAGPPSGGPPAASARRSRPGGRTPPHAACGAAA